MAPQGLRKKEEPVTEKKIIRNRISIATKTLRRGKNGRKNTISDGFRAVE